MEKSLPFFLWKTLNEIFKNKNEAKKLEIMKKMRIEDKGYEVVFTDGKAYLKHLSSCQIKQFCVRINSLYTLQEDAYTILRRKAGIRDVVEREHDLALKKKPQPMGNSKDQDDDDE